MDELMYLVKVYNDNRTYSEIDWKSITPFNITNYPWYKSGLKQETIVKIVRTTENLYINVLAKDVHSSAVVLDPNGGVYTDSCFEFFVTPEQDISEYYINIEINCIGTLYLAVKNATGKRRANLSELKQVCIRTSLEKGVVKTLMHNDISWSLFIEIPLTFLESFWGKSINSKKWQGNFYRCGGKIEDQYATWSPINFDTPNFHLPNFFSAIVFE